MALPSLSDNTPVLLDAVRTPFGKRDGWLAPIHAADLLGRVQVATLDRAGVAADQVDQVIGGCVTPAGEQYGHITRTAWLYAGLPARTGATTIDAQCGTSAQASLLLAGQIAMGAVDLGVSCGVELMSRVPLTPKQGRGLGTPRPEDWSIDSIDQYTGADRIARKRGFSRTDLDAYGLRSQRRARAAWDAGRFDGQILTIEGITQDQGLRESSMEALAKLKPVKEDGLHTAGSSSQISDGASAAVWASARRASELGLTPRARVVSQCVIGGDLDYLLDGPAAGGRILFDRLGMAPADIDVFEVNEAFAAVPMSFAQVHGVDEENLNPNGGAIAIGHPAGATGIRLIATALAELVRREGQFAMVAICASASTTCLVLERL